MDGWKEYSIGAAGMWTQVRAFTERIRTSPSGSQPKPAVGEQCFSAT